MRAPGMPSFRPGSSLRLLVVGSIGVLALAACGRSGTALRPPSAGGPPPPSAASAGGAISGGTSSVRKAHWYSAAWRLRRRLVVENSAPQTLTSYQVKVSLPSTFDFSDTAPTGNDIRFTDSDGTTTLTFWKETFDSAML